MTQRYAIIEAHGIARRMRHSEAIKFDHVRPSTVSESTVRRRVAELRQYASGVYDTFNDVTFDDGVRSISARHYVTGVENVRTLRIEAVR